MRDLFHRHPVTAGILALSVALMLFFAVRLTVGAVYWSQHRAEPVAGWMTIRYVGRSWQVDPRAIIDLTGYTVPQGNPVTIEEIAKARGVPVGQVITEIEDAVARLRAGDGPDGDVP